MPILENGPGERFIRVARPGKDLEPGVYLRWTRQPRVVVEKLTAASLPGYVEMSPEDIADENASMAAEAAAARIIGRDWLVKHADRRARKTSHRKQRFDRTVRGVPRDDCRARTCGRATRLRVSGLLWVVTGDTSDHDDAWVVCDLYDPESRLWAYTEEVGERTWSKETTGSAGGYSCRAQFDASEAAYLSGFRACGVRSGCVELRQESPLGWLDPGIELVPPKPETESPW